MKLIDLIKKLAQNAAISPEDAHLLKALGLPQLADLDIDDAIATPMTNLMGMDAAKANPALGNHFKATVLNGLDEQFRREAEAAGIDAAKIAEWMAPEVKTGKRFELMLAHLKSDHAEALRKKGSGSEETKVLNDQINALQAKMADQEKTWTQKVTAQEQAMGAERTNWQIQKLIGAFERNPNITPAVFESSALPILTQKLLEKGAKISYKDNVAKLVRIDNEETEFYDGATKVELTALAKEILLEAQLVAASKGGAPEVRKTEGLPDPNPQPPSAPNEAFNDILKQSLADLKK